MMNPYTQERIRMVENVEKNDISFTKLIIGGLRDAACTDEDYSRLGRAIGKNTHLLTLEVHTADIVLTTANTQFFDGLRQNESIEKLTLLCDDDGIGIVGCAILSAYHGSYNLSCLCIWDCELESDSAIAATLRCCPNLKEINIYSSTFTDSQMIPLIEGRGLEKLDLEGTAIGNDVCESLATLLRDPDSNLHTLYLSDNNISNIGAITIANSLAKNSNLKRLRLLDQNQMDQGSGLVDVFNRVLCDTSSLNSTYSMFSTEYYVIHQVSIVHIYPIIPFEIYMLGHCQDQEIVISLHL